LTFPALCTPQLKDHPAYCLLKVTMVLTIPPQLLVTPATNHLIVSRTPESRLEDQPSRLTHRPLIQLTHQQVELLVVITLARQAAP
jgi:hypothetical protein